MPLTSHARVFTYDCVTAEDTPYHFDTSEDGTLTLGVLSTTGTIDSDGNSSNTSGCTGYVESASQSSAVSFDNSAFYFRAVDYFNLVLVTDSDDNVLLTDTFPSVTKTLNQDTVLDDSSVGFPDGFYYVVFQDYGYNGTSLHFSVVDGKFYIDYVPTISSDNVPVVKALGSLNFGLAVILCLMFVQFIWVIYNSFTSKKQWR